MKRWIAILLPIFALGFLIAWRIHSKNVETATQDQQRAARSKAPAAVSVAAASYQDIVHTFKGIGSVESPFNVKISSKVTGLIDYLQVREGDHVQKGQVLVRIDPTQVQAQIREQQATIAEAQSRLAQAQLTQNPTNVNVTATIKQQVANLASVQADYDQTVHNYDAQVAAAQATVTDMQGRVDSANSTISNAQANIRSCQANVDNANAKLNRTTDLYKQGYVAAQDVDDARTAVSVAQGALDVARSQLTGAQASKDSALAEKDAAQKQANIVVVKGKSDIVAAKQRVAQAKAALDVARSNTAQTPAYVQNLAALRATVVAAQAQLRNLQAQLSDTVQTSPIDGYVSMRAADPGSVVTPGQALLNVVELQEVYVNVPVPEEVSRRIAVGKTASMEFDALPGRTFTGRISYINPAADPQSRQFPVRITLDNHQDLIKPGMFARIAIEIERIPNALVVPREAIQPGKGGPSVIVVSDKNVVQRRPVTTGANDVNGIQITGGLQPGEQVVTLSAAPLRDGQPVRIASAGKRPGTYSE